MTRLRPLQRVFYIDLIVVPNFQNKNYGTVMYIGRLDVSMMVKVHCLNNCTKPATVELPLCLVS